jgi:HAD superfamily hydrolase (TIGR01509 family)
MSKFNLGEKEFDAILEKIVNKYEPLKFLWNLLPALRKKYKLAIINNGTALTLREFENRYNIKVRFDLFVSSALEGIKKPRKDIYLSAASQLKVNPKNCLFMDDSELNIRGAKRCGMKTIWWKTQEDGIADFKKFIAAD